MSCVLAFSRSKCYYTLLAMKRTVGMKLISTILAALALAFVSAQAEAGVMLWQVTGMEGSGSR